MRTWQVERRKRTRHLIELGGLVVKAGLVDLTGDDRATILGALLWMADKLQSDQRERVRALWAAKGKQAFGDRFFVFDRDKPGRAHEVLPAITDPIKSRIPSGWFTRRRELSSIAGDVLRSRDAKLLE